ncbi:molybdopterin molybdotransferase MoeA [Marinobacterium maritimum]|uniref:Molybdopterin molybdenumtransferase n=1 Tax=Marinobacterium maritimum TaxID=500162 RepID=A0ABN1I5T0_9GAMM
MSCDQQGLLPLATAIEALLSDLEPVAVTESVDLLQARNRVLAEAIHSRVDVPPADNSAMDGYAVRMLDLIAAGEDWLPVSQRVPAGQAPGPLQPGTVARILTGAEVPPGADIVVMQELAEVKGERVRLPLGAVPGQNIRRRGQDIHSGGLLLPAGRRLDAMAIAVLASAGIERVSVYCPLKVALLCTGDELVPPGQPLAHGQIYNSNRYLLHGLIETLGMEVVDLGQVADDPASLEQVLLRAAEQADAILTTGGVSVGEEDHLRPAIERLGELTLWKINLKPGKPFAAGVVEGTPIFGLPGNPGSALLTFALLARPCLNRLQGDTAIKPFSVTATAGFSRERRIKREEYVRVYCEADGTLQLASQQSSGALSPMLHANGFARLPANQPVELGQALDFYPLDGLVR